MRRDMKAPKNPANENDRAIPAEKCPICGQPATIAHRPFCSKRCADVDLARWLGGTYAIPVVETDPEEDEEDAPPARPRTPRED